MSALCAALTFRTPWGTQITPPITSLPWEALLDGTDRAAASSQTPPGAQTRKKHLHFPLLLPLCCGAEVCDGREIPQVPGVEDSPLPHPDRAILSPPSP